MYTDAPGGPVDSAFSNIVPTEQVQSHLLGSGYFTGFDLPLLRHTH